MPSKIKQFIKRIVPKTLLEYIQLKRKQFDILFTYHRVKKTYKKTRADSDGSRMKIVFIVQRTEVFSSVKSIYEAALRDNNTEVYLLALPRCRNEKFELLMDTLDSVYQFCQGLGGGNVIRSYDAETDSFFDLSSISPDYVFLNVPYTFQYPRAYHIDNLSKFTKVCFVPYGYAFGNVDLYTDVYNTGLHHHVMQKASFIFADSHAAYKFCRKKTKYSEFFDGKRLYELGYPRFDNVSVSRTENDKLTALWIPRWTSPEQSGLFNSSFFRFKDNILSVSEEFDFIIRPHPLAFENYVLCGNMTAKEVEEFKTCISERDNLSLDQTPDYHTSFDRSDVLVADFSSIVAEYFMTGKPIIYCSGTEEISPDLKFMTDTFYFARSWDDVDGILKKLDAGDDPLKEKREAAARKFLSECSQSGQRIFDFLKKDFQKDT